MTSSFCHFSDELLDHLRHQRHAEAKNCLIGIDRPSRLVDARGASLLHCAAERSNAHMTRYFLDSGFAIDQRDHEGQTPLAYALIRTWNPATVELLVRRGADIYVRARNDCEYSLLYVALSTQKVAAIRAFLYRVRRDYPTNDQLASILHENLCTLHAVVYLRNAEVTRLLLERGHCPAQTYHGGITTLGMAIRLLDLEHVKLLIDRGMDVNALAPTELLPVDSIPPSNRPPKLEIMKLLIDNGADFCRKRSFIELQETTCHVVFRHGTREMVRLLLRANRDFALKNMQTLLICLALNRNEGAIAEIKGMEYDANLWDRDGRTALDYAAQHGLASAIEFLLSDGADVDAPSRYGNWAALSRIIVCELRLGSKMERLKMLLEHGADPQRAFDRYYNQSTTPLEQVVARENLRALAKPLLAYVVLRERILRQPATRKTLSIVEADGGFERYFQLCKTHVEVMEKTRIRPSVTLLDLLTKDVEWIANSVKNSDLGSEMRRLCRELRLNNYYSDKLQRRGKEIVHVVNIRQEVASIFSDIFGHLYRNNHLIIDKIVSFISFQDLQKALQTETESDKITV